MAKDYFQDITPPGGRPEPRPESDPPEVHEPPPEGSKSIRNIPISTARPRPRYDDPRDSGVVQMPPPKANRGSRIWLWGGVVLALFALGAIALVALRPTSVTVIPRSHAILFDDTARFTAYPANTATEGTLPFTIESATFDDSQSVPASGTEKVDAPAGGQVTVYNDFQTTPLKLLKNTRFEMNGLIFKSPAEIMVPAKSATKPGSITVTVVAEKTGEAYNVPAGKFTLPGLKSTPDMFAKVYAESSAAFTGGFSGTRPAIPQSAEDAARAEIRSRLEQKARDAATKAATGKLAFPELARITYETLPPSESSRSSVRMNERVHVEVPVFPEDTFAMIIARSVSAEPDGATIRLVPTRDFRATRITPTDTPLSDPLEFTLEGSAKLVWQVDTEALKTALAGKSEDAFPTIVQGFSAIEEAHARIEPFWKKSFPASASSIKVAVEEPKAE